METYRWRTPQPHNNNNVTMDDYLNNHLPQCFDVVFEDGTYAEIKNKNTDRETLVFMVFNPRIDTSKVMHNNIVEHPNQLKLIDTDAL